MEDKQALQQAGAALVTQLTEWLQHAGEFTQAQAPDVLQQMLEWGAFYYFWVAIALTILVALFAALSVLVTYDDPDSVIVPVILAFLLSLPAGYHWFGYLYICHAPKLYLLEQLRHLL